MKRTHACVWVRLFTLKQLITECKPAEKPAAVMAFHITQACHQSSSSTHQT